MVNWLHFSVVHGGQNIMVEGHDRDNCSAQGRQEAEDGKNQRKSLWGQNTLFKATPI